MNNRRYGGGTRSEGKREGMMESSTEYRRMRNRPKVENQIFNKAEDPWTVLRSLKSNKMYIFITLALSLLYYIITGI